MLELCFGDILIASECKKREMQWTGIDLNPTFVNFAIRHGFHAIGTNFPQNSVGWYRRVFEIPAVDKGRTVWIEFGGVYRNALVWLNGHCLGRMASGYTSFYFDVTDRLNFGGANTLVVRVDATKEEGWFYEGAGIYRHVWLIKTQPVHVAHWGTFVTSKVTGKKAALGIETMVENSSSQPAKAEFMRMTFPPRWHFDFLRGLDYFQSIRAPRDARMQEAITLLLSKQNASGSWNLNQPWAGRVYFTMETPGHPSRWNTLRALRVLKWWEGQ